MSGLHWGRRWRLPLSPLLARGCPRLYLWTLVRLGKTRPLPRTPWHAAGARTAAGWSSFSSRMVISPAQRGTHCCTLGNKASPICRFTEGRSGSAPGRPRTARSASRSRLTCAQSVGDDIWSPAPAPLFAATAVAPIMSKFAVRDVWSFILAPLPGATASFRARASQSVAGGGGSSFLAPRPAATASSRARVSRVAADVVCMPILAPLPAAPAASRTREPQSLPPLSDSLALSWLSLPHSAEHAGRRWGAGSNGG